MVVCPTEAVGNRRGCGSAVAAAIAVPRSSSLMLLAYARLRRACNARGHRQRADGRVAHLPAVRRQVLLALPASGA